MIKEWCETCKGMGYIYESQYVGEEYIGDDDTECVHCKGKGYIELQQSDLKELQFIADKWTDAQTQ